MFERLQPQPTNFDSALVLAKQVAALLATVAGYLTIAGLVHAIARTPATSGDAQYRYTTMLMPPPPALFMVPMVAAFFGWLTRRPWSVAIGMIVPLPFEMSY